MLKSSKYHIILISLISVLLLSGCGTLSSWFRSRNDYNTPLQTETPISQSAAYYLNAAENAPPAQQALLRLQAAQRLLQDRRLSEANTILAQTNIPPQAGALAIQKQLLSAHLAYLQNRSQRALALLQNLPDDSQLPSTLARDRHNLAATIYAQRQQPLASVQQRIVLDTLLTNIQAKHQNHQLTWHTLQQMSTQQLSDAMQQNNPAILQGWLTLATIAAQSNNASANLSTNLSAWRQQYPNHPGNDVLSAQTAPNENATQHLTLLLPLTGPLASSGQAIRNGFLAAYYTARRQQSNPPTIDIVDTNRGNVQTLYQNAVHKGADFVIGPLTKQNVQTLAEQNALPVPTLALNSVSSSASRNLYQFGLTPEDEAIQVADRAWKDGHAHALIIAPQGSWGENIANSFKSRWETLGGDVLDELYYQDDGKGLSAQIQQLLRVDQSESRVNTLKQQLHESIKSVPRRRQDADVIFLLATPDHARQIRPLLRFFYAGDIPIYATSGIYSGTPSPHYDRDLNGIHFCDMPWVLLSPTKLNSTLQATRQQILSAWRNDFKKRSKLYALGIDAYHLSTELNRLIQFPTAGISGATGQLYLDDAQHIYRRLLWATMKNGAPKRI